MRTAYLALAVLVVAGFSAAGTVTAESSTDCDLNTAATVCATAIAEATAICFVEFSTAKCTAKGTVGGQGRSPAGIAGDAAWSGVAKCSLDCNNRERISDSCSWGYGDTNGCGDRKTEDLGSPSDLFGCSQVRVVVDTSADATLDLGRSEDAFVSSFDRDSACA